MKKVKKQSVFPTCALSKKIVLLLILTSFFGLALPQQTWSASATVTTIITNFPQLRKDVQESLWKSLQSTAKVGIKNALRSFYEKLAYDTAVWIGSGDWKQKPLVETKDLGNYIKSSADAAAGAFLDSLLTDYAEYDDQGNPVMEPVLDAKGQPVLDAKGQPVMTQKIHKVKASFNFCQLPDVNSVQFKAILPNIMQKKPYTPDCSASKVWGQLKDRFDKALAFVDDPQSLVKFSTSFDQGATDMSTVLAAWDEAINVETAAEREATLKRLKSDFNPKTSKIAGYVVTPAGLIEAQVKSTQDKATVPESTMQNDIAADALSVFVNTLASKWIERLSSGLMSFFAVTDINSSLAGTSSTTGSGGGITGAKDRFASFKTPSFKKGGTVDILNDLTNCEGQDVTNCVISEGLRQAIDNQLTVGEALRNGDYLTASDTISLSKAKILRRYSIVPVGWELAAQYRQDFDLEGINGAELTIQEAVNAFNQCDVDNYSPYCGLVDPDWVLKAPENYCKLEGYGNNLATDPLQNPVDTDGNPYSPKELPVTRLESCLDSQSCLSEDANGNCLAYGYCTKQKPIYRFQGDSCPAYASSCEVFTNADNDQVGYLQNTLNHGDCNNTNAGCAWYCTETDADGKYTCTEPDPAKTMMFDDDIVSCNEEDATCAEFIPIKGGTNLLFNPSFEQFNGNRRPSDQAKAELPLTNTAETEAAYDDEFGFYDQAGGGASCRESSTGQACYGWELKDGLSARASLDLLDGVVVAEIANNGGSLQSALDTGQPLANRSFVFSFTSKNITNEASCAGTYWLAALATAPGQTPTQSQGVMVGSSGNVSSKEFSIEYPADATTYQQTSSGRVTFGADVYDTVIQVGISAPDNCIIAIDQAKLEENTDTTGYSEYGATKTTLKTSVANSCEINDIGCELYTPQTGENKTPIPGTITNPYSQACGDGNDFATAACSQCTEKTVGCDAFIETPTAYSAPAKSITGFETAGTYDALSAEAKTAIASRTGQYCDGTDTVCSNDGDCDGKLCLPSISIVPTTAQTCSATDVGCEEYVNLDTVAAGGEGLEYYKYIRQCVKPTADQENKGAIATYYTFVPTDTNENGYYIQDWKLKKSNINNGPCTNLDLYGASSQTPEADCVDTAGSVQACTTDPNSPYYDSTINCIEYYDDSGKVYYLNKDATITVADECVGMRNTLDGRIYFTVPSESTQCSAQNNLCREYRGSQSDSAEIILEEDFNNNVWDGDSSDEVVGSAGGASMAIGTATPATTASVSVSGKVTDSQSYLVSFWAKKTDYNAQDKLVPHFFAASDTATAPITPIGPIGSIPTDDISNQKEQEITLGIDWQRYIAGPFVLPSLSGDEFFGFNYNGPQANIDNVTIYESDSYYLIHGSAQTCPGYEGCEQYIDNQNTTHFLKSFSKLCNSDVVGCQALLDTHNADLPYYEKFNTDNESPKDDVEVSPAQAVARVVTSAALCNAESAGCSAFGEPSFNNDNTINADGYSTKYFINDPDQYSVSLCQDQQLFCEEWDTGDGMSYFKDPGNKYCTYNATIGEWVTPDGVTCPALQNPGNPPSQPKGAICNQGPRQGQPCQRDEDCSTDDDSSSQYRCSSKEDNLSGWVGICSNNYKGCTTYIDPNTPSLLKNSSFDVDIWQNSDTTIYQSDNLPDDWNVAPVDLQTNFHKTADNSSATACQSFELSPAVFYDGKQSLKLQTNTQTADHCLAVSEAVGVNSNKTYTLSGHVYVNSADAKFALGLLYYQVTGSDANGNILAELSVPEQTVDDFAVAAYEGGTDSTKRSDITGTGQWLRFSATIGNNLEHSFPAGTDAVKVFVESGNNTNEVYFDDVIFSEDEEYNYINNSVDGAPQGDQPSCANGVDKGDGCVAFRDTTNDSLNNLSTIEQEKSIKKDFAPQICTFNSSSVSDSCNSRFNTADTNLVIKVKNDRECAQWLSCELSMNNSDDPTQTAADKNCFESGECSCLSLRLCDQRNLDTGVCSHWAEQKIATELDNTDDLSVALQPGDDIAPKSIQNDTGFTTMGAVWSSICNVTTGKCVGGKLHNEDCASDADCPEAITYGYYPYSWMPQQGMGGSSTQNLIEHGDFENVYCNAQSPWYSEDYDNTVDVKFQNALERARDMSLSCTIDYHCRTPETDSQIESIEAQEENGGSSTNVQSLAYEKGWCKNTVNNVNDNNYLWEEWSTVGGAKFGIIDYDANASYETTAKDQINTVDTNFIGATIAATGINLNNVLYVEPVKNDQQGGIISSLSSGVSSGMQYTLSFDAQYIGEPTAADLMQIGLRHGADDTAIDYFVDGAGISFSRDYEHYTLGPVTISHKKNDGDQTSLFFQQASGSTGMPFVIDNISLSPALEMNKENNPHASQAAWVTSQECRGYPTDTAPACYYKDNSGIIYSGWKGYCVEHDVLDPEKCVTWWPIDVIAGDSLSGRIPMRYNQKAPAYHCLVAKGNADLGVCAGADTMCIDNEDCAGGSCIGNGTEVYNEANGVTEDLHIFTGNYTVLQKIASLDLSDNKYYSYGIFRRFKASPVERLIPISEIDHITFDIGTPVFSNSADETDTTVQQQQNNTWRLSNTATGDYDPANGFNSTQWEFNPTNNALFQAGYQQKEASLPNGGNNANGAYVFQAGAWCDDLGPGASSLCDADSTPDDMDFVFVKAVTSIDGAPSIVKTGRVFNGTASPEDNGKDFSARTTYTASPYNPFNAFPELQPESSAWTNGGVSGNVNDTMNKVGNVALNRQYFMNQTGGTPDEEAAGCNTNSVCGANIVGIKFDFKDGYLDAVYLFYLNGTSDHDMAENMLNVQWSYFLKEPCLLAVESADSNANATAWYDRIQQATQYRTQDTKYSYNMLGTTGFFGKIGGNNDAEPTILDGFADDNLINFTAKGTNLPGIYINTAAGSTQPYGCIGNCNAITCEENYDQDFSPANLNSCGSGSIHPWMGAAGVCSQLNDAQQTQFCNDHTDCSKGSCLGSSGNSSAGVAAPLDQNKIKMQDIDDDNTNDPGDNCPFSNPDCLAAYCADPDNALEPLCTSTTTPAPGTGGVYDNTPFVGYLSGLGTGAQYYTYLDQLNAATKKAWDRFRLLFADVNKIYFANELDLVADTPDDFAYKKQRYETKLTPWDQTSGNSVGLTNFCPDTDKTVAHVTNCNAFDQNGDGQKDFQDNNTMSVCLNNERGSADYCGLRPQVKNLTINNQTENLPPINSGQSVVLQFDSQVDPSQEPLQIIRINWNAQINEGIGNFYQTNWEAASKTGHYFTKSFTCDPMFDANQEQDVDGNCLYRVRVQLQDKWGFCSGNIEKEDGVAGAVVLRDVNFGPCTSYDEYPALIKVAPL